MCTCPCAVPYNYVQRHGPRGYIATATYWKSGQDAARVQWPCLSAALVRPRVCADEQYAASRGIWWSSGWCVLVCMCRSGPRLGVEAEASRGCACGGPTYTHNHVNETKSRTCGPAHACEMAKWGMCSCCARSAALDPVSDTTHQVDMASLYRATMASSSRFRCELTC